METFKRDETNMHAASASIIWLSAVAWVCLFTGVIMLFFQTSREVGICILGVVAVYWVFSETYFNFQEGVTIQFKQKHVHYEYKLNNGVVPSGDCRVRIDMKDIKKVKVKGKKAVVYGNIIVKQPLVKAKFPRKVEIFVNFGEDKDKVIQNLKNCVGGV